MALVLPSRKISLIVYAVHDYSRPRWVLVYLGLEILMIADP